MEYFLAKSEGCMFCGKELLYSQTNRDNTCIVCEKVLKSNVMCPDGHYVCDSCHSMSGIDFIEKACSNINSKDPLELATLIM